MLDKVKVGKFRFSIFTIFTIFTIPTRVFTIFVLTTGLVYSN